MAIDVTLAISFAFTFTGVARMRVGVDTRIGCINLIERARGIVGQGHIDLAIVWIDGAPLRTVHARSTRGIGSETCIDQHICLIAECVISVIAVDIIQAELEFQPLACAVGIETCGKELAFV